MVVLKMAAGVESRLLQDEEAIIQAWRDFKLDRQNHIWLQVDEFCKADLHGIVGEGSVIAEEFIFAAIVLYPMDVYQILFVGQAAEFSCILFGGPHFFVHCAMELLAVAIKDKEAGEREDKKLHGKYINGGLNIRKLTFISIDKPGGGLR